MRTANRNTGFAINLDDNQENLGEQETREMGKYLKNEMTMTTTLLNKNQKIFKNINTIKDHIISKISFITSCILIG